MITFDKNVPIPDKGKRQPKPDSIKSIIGAMEEGDSYLFKDKKIHNIRAVISAYFNSKQYTARTVEGGVRVWRIS